MQGPGLDGTLLIMNKGISTPLNCARRKPGKKAGTFCYNNLVMLNMFVNLCLPDLTEHHVDNSVLALVDGEAVSLHHPLTRSCTLKLLTFKDSDPKLANQVHLQTQAMVESWVEWLHLGLSLLTLPVSYFAPKSGYLVHLLSINSYSWNDGVSIQVCNLRRMRTLSSKRSLKGWIWTAFAGSKWDSVAFSVFPACVTAVFLTSLHYC